MQVKHTDGQRSILIEEGRAGRIRRPRPLGAALGVASGTRRAGRPRVRTVVAAQSVLRTVRATRPPVVTLRTVGAAGPRRTMVGAKAARMRLQLAFELPGGPFLVHTRQLHQTVIERRVEVRLHDGAHRTAEDDQRQGHDADAPKSQPRADGRTA